MGALDRALAERAQQQLGLVTRPQLRELGLSDRMVHQRLSSGALVRVHPAVFRLAGSPVGWRQRLLAAVLAGGTGAVASHRAAAVLHRLDGFATAPVELTSGRDRNRFPGDVVVHRPIRFMDVDREAVGAIPCASVALTLINLGAVCRPERVQDALDGALRDGRVGERFLRWRLDQLAARGRPGIGVMRRLLDEKEGRRPHSMLERRFLRAWDASGLPRPILQYEFYDARGSLIARVDFYWPHRRLVLEVDGHAFHATRKQRASDSARTLRLAAIGLQVVTLTYEQVVHTPEWAVSQVAAALRGAA